jgi:hypothetical protein
MGKMWYYIGRPSVFTTHQYHHTFLMKIPPELLLDREIRNFILLAARGAAFVEGKFDFYFAVLLLRAKHLGNGYHNLTHTIYVAWRCAQAAHFYVSRGEMTPREARILILAALFHDWDHTGRMASDKEQIARAIAGLRKFLLPEDMHLLDQISQAIWATEFPHKEIPNPSLLQLILRDADISQSLQQTWLQQTLLGFAEEWMSDPISILQKQESFIGSLKFHTVWGQKFLAPLVPEKLEDVRVLMTDILSNDNIHLVNQRDPLPLVA